MSERIELRLASALLVVAACAACGSRSSLDESVAAAPAGSGGPATDGGGGVTDGAAPLQSDLDGSAADGGGGSLAATGPVGCALCIADRCGGGLSRCAQQTRCRAILTCAATRCVLGSLTDGGGAGPDEACLLTCASGEAGGVAEVLPLATCVQASCGATCVSALGAPSATPTR